MYLFAIFFVYLVSVVIAIALQPRNQFNFGNSLYFLFVIGLIFYGGTSIASDDIPMYYIVMYFVFLTILSVSYHIFYKALSPFGAYATQALQNFSENFFTDRNAKKVIAIFFLLTLIPLLVPDFRLDLIFNPPTPDLTTSFMRRVEEEKKHPIVQFSELIKLLVTPLFYVSLFSLRRNMLQLIAVVFFVFYLEFVDAGYKSRGQLIVGFFPIVFYIWHFLPKYRKPIVFLSLIFSPFVVIFFSFYENYRLGADVSFFDFGFVDSIEHIFKAETSFPLMVGIPIIESGASVDLQAYFTWILTLPIPKFIFGDIAGARINTEISEIFFGLSRYQTGFYIVLPGLIAESVYIFGKYLFWLHAIFFGFIFAFLTRMFQGNKNFVFLVAYFAILVMYNTNRGGIAASLPQISNQLFFIYFILIMFFFGRRNK